MSGFKKIKIKIITPRRATLVSITHVSGFTHVSRGKSIVSVDHKISGVLSRRRIHSSMFRVISIYGAQ